MTLMTADFEVHEQWWVCSGRVRTRLLWQRAQLRYVPRSRANMVITDTRLSEGKNKSVCGYLCVRELTSWGKRTKKPLLTESTLPRGTRNSSGRRERRLGADSENIATRSGQSRRPLNTDRMNITSDRARRDLIETQSKRSSSDS